MRSLINPSLHSMLYGTKLGSWKKEIGPVSQVCPPPLNPSVGLSQAKYTIGATKSEIPALIAKGSDAAQA